MVANCSNVMNKARQPPPGVMPKGRPPSASSLDAISPVQVDKRHAAFLEGGVDLALVLLHYLSPFSRTK